MGGAYDLRARFGERRLGSKEEALLLQSRSTQHPGAPRCRFEFDDLAESRQERFRAWRSRRSAAARIELKTFGDGLDGRGLTRPVVTYEHRHGSVEVHSVRGELCNCGNGERPVLRTTSGIDVGALDVHRSVGHRPIDVSGDMRLVDAAFVVDPVDARMIRSISEPVSDTLRAQSARAGVVATEIAGYVHEPTVCLCAAANYRCTAMGDVYGNVWCPR